MASLGLGIMEGVWSGVASIAAPLSFTAQGAIMTGLRRIALLMRQDAGFHRQVLLGVRAFASHRKQWLFHNAAPTAAILRPLREWNPHGIIAHLDDAKFAREIIAFGKPVVDTACVLHGLDIPTVDVDHAAVGKIAAEYFLARGFRHFGYFGSGRACCAQWRLSSYCAVLEKAGLETSVCHVEYLPHLPDRTSWKGVRTQVRRWLKNLPKPVAVLADHDVAAHDLADICQQIGLGVPNDVAILGVDDDELVCQLAFPPLSSVAIPSERIGFEAAKLLDRMLSGRTVRKDRIFLPPVRIVARHSTSMFAVDEPIVTAALHYIRNHISEPLSVGIIADALTVRRRLLEQKFRELLGRSVLDEIHSVRIENVKSLLATSDLPMSSVAKQSGFSSPQRMAMLFHKMSGLAPCEFRRQNRADYQEERISQGSRQ
jgi:LacI family transcriptional regulator